MNRLLTFCSQTSQNPLQTILLIFFKYIYLLLNQFSFSNLIFPLNIINQQQQQPPLCFCVRFSNCAQSRSLFHSLSLSKAQSFLSPPLLGGLWSIQGRERDSFLQVNLQPNNAMCVSIHIKIYVCNSAVSSIFCFVLEMNRLGFQGLFAFFEILRVLGRLTLFCATNVCSVSEKMWERKRK